MLGASFVSRYWFFWWVISFAYVDRINGRRYWFDWANSLLRSENEPRRSIKRLETSVDGRRCVDRLRHWKLVWDFLFHLFFLLSFLPSISIPNARSDLRIGDGCFLLIFNSIHSDGTFFLKWVSFVSSSCSFWLLSLLLSSLFVPFRFVFLFVCLFVCSFVASVAKVVRATRSAHLLRRPDTARPMISLSIGGFSFMVRLVAVDVVGTAVGNVTTGRRAAIPVTSPTSRSDCRPTEPPFDQFILNIAMSSICIRHRSFRTRPAQSGIRTDIFHITVAPKRARFSFLDRGASRFFFFLRLLLLLLLLSLFFFQVSFLFGSASASASFRSVLFLSLFGLRRPSEVALLKSDRENGACRYAIQRHDNTVKKNKKKLVKSQENTVKIHRSSRKTNQNQSSADDCRPWTSNGRRKTKERGTE